MRENENIIYLSIMAFLITVNILNYSLQKKEGCHLYLT